MPGHLVRRHRIEERLNIAQCIVTVPPVTDEPATDRHSRPAYAAPAMHVYAPSSGEMGVDRIEHAPHVRRRAGVHVTHWQGLDPDFLASFGGKLSQDRFIRGQAVRNLREVDEHVDPGIEERRELLATVVIWGTWGVPRVLTGGELGSRDDV